MASLFRPIQRSFLQLSQLNKFAAIRFKSDASQPQAPQQTIEKRELAPGEDPKAACKSDEAQHQRLDYILKGLYSEFVFQFPHRPTRRMGCDSGR
jgi:hypothetical protein